MSGLRKPVAALVGLFAALVAGLFFAVSPAGAYPGSTPAAVSVSTTTPAPGASLAISGSGFEPGETISLVFHSTPTSLGSVTADSSGAFSTSVTIPAGASGSHEIVGTGLTSGAVATIALDVGGSSSSSSGSGSSGLSDTGVAVIGIGAVGVVLLVGGGLLMLAGKRRKVSV